MQLLIRLAAVLAAIFGPVLSTAAAWPPGELTVFAAASLTNVLQEIGEGYTKSSGIPVKFSFAASSALARQIESGAPADVFLSADLEWMDYLQQRSAIDAGSRRNVVGNRLVLIAPLDSKLTLRIAPGFALAKALGDGRLATGDPASVPVGRYAQAALTSLGVWQQIEPRLVRADNVRAALTYVARGEVPLGIVYETDALIDQKVKVIDVFPADSHAPIVYPVAVTTGARPAGKGFLDYLRSKESLDLFSKHGFTPLP